MQKAQTSPAESDSARLSQLICGYWVSQAIYVAAKLKIADHLAAGPNPADYLASAVGAQPAALYRLLRALASVGIFAESIHGFSLTPLAEGLRSDGPNSLRAMAVMMGEEHYHAWGGLLGSVQTGEASFDKIYGLPIFDFLAKNAEQAAIFDQAMVSIHGRETAAMLQAYDFSQYGVLVDLGGGNGSLLSEVLQKHPGLRGVLYDLPHVAERAQATFAAANLQDRCEIIPGNFFEAAPPSADAYLMRHIIHDWDDAKAGQILRNVHRAMQGRGRLLLVESVVPPGNEPSFTKLLDLTMLLIPGGMERTEAQYRELLASAGFRLDRIVATESEISVIESQPI